MGRIYCPQVLIGQREYGMSRQSWINQSKIKELFKLLHFPLMEINFAMLVNPKKYLYVIRKLDSNYLSQSHLQTTLLN